MSPSAASFGKAGTQWDGCRRSTVHTGTFRATYMRDSNGGVSGTITLDWKVATNLLQGCTGPDMDGETTSTSSLYDIQNQKWSVAPFKSDGNVLKLEQDDHGRGLWGSWFLPL